MRSSVAHEIASMQPSGSLHYNMHDQAVFQKAEELYNSCSFEESLAVIKQMPVPHSYEVLKLKGKCYWRMSRLPEAEVNFRESLEVAMSEESRENIPGAYMTVGVILFEKEEFIESVEYLQKSVSCFGENECSGLANTLNWLGQAYSRLDLWDMAAKTYIRGLEVTRNIDDRLAEAYIRSNTGLLQMSMDNHQAAQESFRKALDLNREADNPYGIADVLSNIGISLYTEEKFSQAEPYLREGMEAHAKVGALYKEAMVGSDLANTLAALGKRSEALELIGKGLKFVREAGGNRFHLEVLNQAFVLYMKLKMLPEASSAIEEINSFISSKEMNLEDSVKHNHLKAEMAYANNDIEGVYTCLSSSLECAQELARKQNRILSDYLSMERKTQKLEIKARMAHIQKYESLGMLTAGIAHGFNNGLHAILGSINEIARGNKLQDNIERIKDAVSDAGELCNQLLAFAGHASMNPRTINFNEELQGVLQLLVPLEPDVDFLWEPLKGLPPVKVDPILFKNWIISLITNALEAMEGKGEITLSTELRNIDGDSWACVSVTDNGPGINPDHLARVFDPFFSTKSIEKGMSLSVVKGGVESAAGRIEVSSAPGICTRFSLIFPPAAGEETEDDGIAEDSDIQSLRICLIDDEDRVREITKGMLEVLGHEVSCYPGGKEFLKDLSAGANPDCIILDMTMPEMTGSQVFLRLREWGCKAPVLLISGFSSRGDASIFGDDVPAVFLQKPFRLKELRTAIWNAMLEN